MADRYQDRSFPSDGFGRGRDPQVDADPLAELARLIGQTDAQSGRGPSRAPAARQPEPAIDRGEPSIPPGPPSWMQRANRQEIPRGQQQIPASARDPFAELSPQRPAPAQAFSARDFSARDFAAQTQGHYEDQHDEDDAEPDFGGHDAARQATAPQPFAEQDFADELAKLDFRTGDARHQYGRDDAQADAPFHREPAFDEPATAHDPSRYDEALFGQLGPAQQDYQGGQDFQDDHFGYQDYDEAEQEEAPKRRGGRVMVLAILVLGFLGTGGAFAYRTYFSAARSGEPPIIRADNSPTKIMASPADSSPKVPDRLLSDGGEKLVSREETPVDPGRSVVGGGPRVVFPQLNQNSSPPSPASVAPSAMASAPPPSASNNGTLPNGDPRPIKTFSVTGNQQQADVGSTATTQPAIKPAKIIAAQPVVPHSSPANANASASAAPMAITPQQTPASAAAGGSGGYLVSISSQNSEAEAISSYQAVQAKYSSVLGSYSPIIKRMDFGDKGIKYRAAVGPFASRDEANKMCGSLKSAGGQCFAFSN